MESHTMDTQPRRYRGWAAAVAYGGYAGCLLSALFSTWLLADFAGLSHSLSAGLSIFWVGMLVWALEFILPYEASWKPTRRVLLLDMLHTLVSSQLVAPVLKASIAALVIAIFTTKGVPIGLGVWPNHWPLALQLLIAVPLADVGVYFAHRWMHATNPGWRIHAVHHSPTGLHFWASARTHPFNAALTLLMEISPLLLLGIGPRAFTLWLVYMSVNGLLQHSNVDFRPGPLSLFLATNEAHRLHHSIDLAHAHSNFGNTTMVWDQLFRTFQKTTSPIRNIGTHGYAIPERYWTHLLSPFVLNRFATPDPNETNDTETTS